MKKLLFLFISALFSFTCAESKTVTVKVSNQLNIERSGEIVEVSMTKISKRMKLKNTTQIIVLSADGEQVPHQITYDGLLIFPVEIAAKATATYTIQSGNPQKIETIAYGRHYPERLDDVAWENDLVAFRAYGPALQASGERGFGYDLFTKKNTTKPTLETRYAKELSREQSYHIDNGYGMDCYAVGPTLGAGVAALMVNNSIVYPWCYKTQEVLNNGPLRFTVKLAFAPKTVKGSTNVVETRIITLDAGSHLNKTIVTYANLQETLPVATGIVLHEPNGVANIVTDTANGYMTYVDPTTAPNQGKIFVGAALPSKAKQIKAVYFSEQERKLRNKANGHLLMVSQYKPKTEYTYYWGFAWDKADIKTPKAWNEYMAHFTQKLRTPLNVDIQ